MGAVGERLRSERLKRGLGLDRISQETKIPTRYLEAIEQEHFEKLPGQLFLISFVRQYARVLGLDEAELIAQLRAQQEPPAPVLAAEPQQRREPPRNWLLFAGSAVVLLVFLLAYTAPWKRVSARATTPSQEATAASRGTADRVASSVPDVQKPLSASVASPGQRVALVAKARTWVAATQDGRTVLAETLQPNETRVLQGSATLDLVIGNPGGVELRLNGKPIDIAGPRGALAEVRIASPDAAPVITHRQPLTDLY